MRRLDALDDARGAGVSYCTWCAQLCGCCGAGGACNPASVSAASPNQQAAAEGRKVEEVELLHSFVGTAHADTVQPPPKPRLGSVNETHLHVVWKATAPPAGATRLEVEFEYEADGIVERDSGTISAKAAGTTMLAKHPWYTFRLRWKDRRQRGMGNWGDWSERMYPVVTVRPAQHAF